MSVTRITEGLLCDRVPIVRLESELFQIAWVSAARKLTFCYSFDLHVFPYAQNFGSYGGLDGHYTAILEPCSSMPLMVSDANRLGRCSVLMPEEGIETRVAIYAGPCLGSDQHWPR